MLREMVLHLADTSPPQALPVQSYRADDLVVLEDLRYIWRNHSHFLLHIHLLERQSLYHADGAVCAETLPVFRSHQRHGDSNGLGKMMN